MSNGFLYTPEQELVIKHEGEALLVSAAAGSGKTRVLVGRLLSRIEQGADITSFLIITYTNAAAAELRGRILEGINEMLAENPRNAHLRRQAMLCRGAQICTIHSFCIDILRESAHLIGIMPEFRVMDEDESNQIKAEVLENLLVEAYETISETEGFRELVDTLSAGRDDRKLVNMLQEIHRKLQSKPYPQAWVASSMEDFEMSSITDAAQTRWGRHLIDKARRTILYWREETARFRESITEFSEFDAAYGGSIEATIKSCDDFLSALDMSWDEAGLCSDIDAPRAKPVSGYDELKAVRKKCIEAMKKCTAVFKCASADYIADMRSIEPAVRTLLELVIRFDTAYLAEKRRRGIVDFSDLEHLALSLLIDRQTTEKTEIAKEISNRYHEIMIDEYQDVNSVQELIFGAVSRDGRNIFMVGDVKQSIYRFRLADPSIFLDKYMKYSEVDSSGAAAEAVDMAADEPSDMTVNSASSPANGRNGSCGGRRIMLSKNFRSRPGVLDAVNYVFGRIMSKEFGEMDYTNKEALVADRQAGESRGCDFELSIIDMSGQEYDEDEESPAAVEIEAGFVAERIAELINSEYSVPGGDDTVRCIKYSDIAILLRSIKGKAWRYATALTQRGIPVEVPSEEGFLETPEISAALSLISIVDNPVQDIPLAAAMRSLAYGFSADELALIRARSRSTDFYGAILKAAESDKKCADFISEIDKLREIAPDLSADRFIWHMYSITGLLGKTGAMRDGAKRRGNLVMLAEYARRYEQSGYKGLFGFLTYVRGLQARGAEPAHSSASVISETYDEDAVRIMSIHKSKGLEFPVVILADTAKKMNTRDLSKPIVFHSELGVGVKYTDKQRRIEYPTLARLAIQSKLTSELMAEELRLLYVAMTRAREKLIITAAFKNAAKETDNLSSESQQKVAPQVLEDAGCMAKWLMIALANDIKLASAQGGSNKAEIGEINITTADNADTTDAEYSKRREEQQQDTPMMLNSETSVTTIELLRERFAYSYPHRLAPDLPSKLTATGLKGLFTNTDSDDVAQKAEFLNTQSIDMRSQTFRRPQFAEKETGSTAAQRGTALHIFMQLINFEKCGNPSGIESELLRLSNSGMLTPEQAEVVNTKKITAFFESEIGKRMINADSVMREFRFSLLYPAEYFFKGGGDDKILLQGMVDCFFEEDGELTVIDFKTDFVTQETVDARKEKYVPQLAIYRDAVERITGKCVKECAVYFFALDKSYLI